MCAIFAVEVVGVSYHFLFTPHGGVNGVAFVVALHILKSAHYYDELDIDMQSFVSPLAAWEAFGLFSFQEAEFSC